MGILLTIISYFFQDYDIILTALCVTDMSENGKRTESETERVHLSTRPDVIKNLKLEKSFEHSFTLKWDAPIGASNVAKYKITISGNTEQAEEPDSAEIQGALYIFSHLYLQMKQLFVYNFVFQMREKMVPVSVGKVLFKTSRISPAHLKLWETKPNILLPNFQKELEVVTLMTSQL